MVFSDVGAQDLKMVAEAGMMSQQGDFSQCHTTRAIEKGYLYFYLLVAKGKRQKYKSDYLMI